LISIFDRFALGLRHALPPKVAPRAKDYCPRIGQKKPDTDAISVIDNEGLEPGAPVPLIHSPTRKEDFRARF